MTHNITTFFQLPTTSTSLSQLNVFRQLQYLVLASVNLCYHRTRFTILNGNLTPLPQVEQLIVSMSVYDVWQQEIYSRVTVVTDSPLYDVIENETTVSNLVHVANPQHILWVSANVALDRGAN